MLNKYKKQIEIIITVFAYFMTWNCLTHNWHLVHELFLNGHHAVAATGQIQNKIGFVIPFLITTVSRKLKKLGTLLFYFSIINVATFIILTLAKNLKLEIPIYSGLAISGIEIVLILLHHNPVGKIQSIIDWFKK